MSFAGVSNLIPGGYIALILSSSDDLLSATVRNSASALVTSEPQVTVD